MYNLGEDRSFSDITVVSTSHHFFPKDSSTIPVKTDSGKFNISHCLKAVKFTMMQKGPSPVFDMINSRPVKRKSTTPSPIVSKKQIPSSCSSGTSKDLGMCTADCQVDFDLNGVRRRCIAKASGDHSSFTTSKTPEDRVIGWCQLNEGSEMGVWLVVRDTTISCFSISRLFVLTV